MMNAAQDTALRFDQGKLKKLPGSPAGTLVMGLVLAVVSMLLPAPWTGAIKGRVAAVLRPGQVGVLGLREQGRRIVERARSQFHTARKLAEAEAQRDRLAEENRRLAAELALANRQPPGKQLGDWPDFRAAKMGLSPSETQPPRPEQESDAAGDCPDFRAAKMGLSPSETPDAGPARPLLNAGWVKARVLGQLARAFLGRRHLLDVGSESGVPPHAVIIEAPPGLIDQGGQVGLKAGQLVLDEGRVWGKVVRVARLTSVVRTVTEPGYRDLVCLGDSGPQGILEGTGEPLARVRLVEVTEPVAVGDLVYSTAGKGLLAEPLLCGRIVRLERPVGAPHWEIWMEPAVDPHRTNEVAVLRIELDPSRVAAVRESKEKGVGSGE